MSIVIREYQTKDVTAAITIWNQVVEDGVAFPQEENLTEETGDVFFKEQTYTAVSYTHLFYIINVKNEI